MNMVAFPEGVLPFRIFNHLYLDLVQRCLADDVGFGIVAILPRQELAKSNNLPFAGVGTAFNGLPGKQYHQDISSMRMTGQQRFRVREAVQRTDGLWVGHVEDIRPDYTIPIPADLGMTGIRLKSIYSSMLTRMSRSELPFGEPTNFEDCNWVANRWCELLDMPVVQKQRLLELDSPLIRLELIQDMLLSDFPKSIRNL